MDQETTPPTRKPSVKRIFIGLGVAIVLIAVIGSAAANLYIVSAIFGEDFSEYDLGYEDDSSYAACNVSGITLWGDLVGRQTGSTDEDGNSEVDQTTSDSILFYIDEAEGDQAIKAILIEIDSYGGYPVAAEEVMNALKRAEKPTVALIREYGDSAAYWAATGADKIFASENSEVGSIGVTMSYIDYSKQNTVEGITYNQISSGKFKDAGNWEKTLTAEEKALFQRDVNILHDNFVRSVAENRNLDIEKARLLADGSTMLGAMAKEKGLIDEIGGIYEVEEYLKGLIGEEPEICW